MQIKIHESGFIDYFSKEERRGGIIYPGQEEEAIEILGQEVFDNLIDPLWTDEVLSTYQSLVADPDGEI